jgi:hypothetical protein
MHGGGSEFLCRRADVSKAGCILLFVLSVSSALGLRLRSESVKFYLDIIISGSPESKNGGGSLD